MRQLDVYMNDIRAGVLIELHPGRGYSFTYTNDYANSSNPPISVSMPKRAESYDARNLFPLFSNMLPEGANRRVICRNLRIDERDFFGLLSAMAGKDFIGAVQVRRTDDDRN